MDKVTTARIINVACWFLFVVYWVATARNVKRTKEVKAGLGYAKWIVFIVAFLLLSPRGLSRRFGATTLLPHSDILMAAGVLFSIAGVVIAIAARRKLAGNWSSMVVLKEDHELITTGLYGYVRHPIYSGILLIALGAAVVNGTVTAIGFFVVVLAFMAYKASLEEQLLTKHFSQDYPAYKARVKRIIPFLW